jgi:hypothetical protein
MGRVYAQAEEAAYDILRSVLLNKLAKCNGNIYYAEDGILYTKDKAVIRTELKRLVESQNITLYNGTTLQNIAVIGECSAARIVGCILEQCVTNKNLEKEIYNSTMYKVCYRNGYYDYENEGFYEYTNTVKTLIRINKDFRELNNEILETMEVVYKILLYPMFSVKSG